MLPLAVILKGLGHLVSGSDRSYDQGRTPEKFRWIESQGITLHPQDGSGITPEISHVVISKAVEDTVPDIAAAKEKNIPILKRVDVLINLFNAARTRIAVSGTSGKTTTTGMAGFLLKEAGLDPTVMNGGIFRNFIHENPYSTAFVGGGDIFVTEVDESDGIDAVVRFAPDIAVIHNVTLDHQPMEELKAMFSGFLAKTRTALLNAEDLNVMAMASSYDGRIVTYSSDADVVADLCAISIAERPDGIDAIIDIRGRQVELNLQVPGRHNISNALAAMAVGMEAGLPPELCAGILARFTGIRRRMEIVGVRNAVTVMDDFAHNPDKIAATLGTLRAFPGRLHLFFQPHGYGFLKVVGPELGESFASHMGADDTLYMVEPLYLGGTVDRSVGAQSVIDDIAARGRNARLMPGREEVKNAILKDVKPGDRIVIMGARDDTLSDFAASILAEIR
jgi:UDP-N-acetylmuramate--alanine ligase